MNNRDLIATTIVDKNGKHTTVHKRIPSTASASTRLAAAKPQASPPTKHIDRLSDDPGTMEGRFKQIILDLPKSRRPSNQRLGKILDGLHPDTLDTLAALQNEWERGTFAVSQTVKQALSKGDATQINNLAFFYDKNLGLDYQRVQFHTYTQGIQEHIGSGVDAATASESLQKSMRALLVAAMDIPTKYVKYVEYEKEEWRVIVSAPLGRLIRDRPDDVDRIIKIMNDRPEIRFHNVDEVSALTALLDQKVAQSLTDGVL